MKSSACFQKAVIRCGVRRVRRRTQRQRAAFDRHLRGCEPCRRFVGELRQVVALLGAVGEDDRRE